jgi:hypothetical protein
MSPVLIELLIQVIAGIFLLLVGVVVDRKLLPDKSILSVKSETPSSKSYKHLEGKWHGYGVTRDPAIHKDTFWLHGEIELKITRNHVVEGKTKITHPTSPIDLISRGEIRSGRMLLVANCVQDPSDFVTYVFQNIYSSQVLVGFWVGSDWQRKYTVAPIIYSREQKNAKELNEIICTAELLEGILLQNADVVISAPSHEQVEAKRLRQ